MQTSLARRQRHRRNGGRNASGGGAARTIAIALPLFLFGTLALVGVAGMVTAVAAYTHYSEGLPDPKTLLENLSFTQQTTVYDRTGQVELAQLGSQKREVVTFAQIPKELVDATTSIEDKTFWSNAGFDPAGIISAAIDSLRGQARGASTITQQLVRVRLLPEAIANGPTYERKISELIQSIRLTQEYGGDAGKQAIMAAYLNQNFYGNNSYGVEAAAQGYFGKPLDQLTLAQMAILAGIPQSPSTYDLVRNAEAQCTVPVAAGATCPDAKIQLVVPPDSEIVQRRNYILELMKTRSVLSGSMHTAAEYDAAKNEPVILAPQLTPTWKAAQFVYQVQNQLGTILCGPEAATSCEAVQTGGYKVTTTLDWSMQQAVEKWLYVSARGPNLKNLDAILKAEKIPSSDWSWIRALRSENINNAASAVEDARTGQILAYAGSAGYSAPGAKAFQPKFDVLSDGYRQPGSSIKPIDYSIGIDDKTLTAATVFMDVVTDFGSKGKPYTPTQADSLERGPVRLRSALQFSLNIPAIKGGLINGLDHQFSRSKDFGLQYLKGTVPVVSMSIGTLETRPIDMLGAYSAIANLGVKMPQQMILEVQDPTGKVVWPTTSTPPAGTKVISPQAAWIVTDILAGNTDVKVNPEWGKWSVVQNGKRRDAAYKTGTTEDTRDVAAYGFLAPPSDASQPQLVVGVWMGNSDNTPTRSLSLDSAAPVWSNILTDISSKMPYATFASERPNGLVQTKVDAFSGMLPGPFTTKTVNEWFIADTVPKQIDDTKVAVTVDAATGLLWQDGCAGPMQTVGALDLSSIEASFPTWQKYDNGWIARARRGPGVAGGPKRTRTSYFYANYFTPFGRTWGARFAPTKTCTPVPVTPPPCTIVTDPFASPDPNLPPPCPSVAPSPAPSSQPTPSPKPTKKPNPSP